jgi:hypothetical protein
LMNPAESTTRTSHFFGADSIVTIRKITNHKFYEVNHVAQRFRPVCLSVCLFVVQLLMRPKFVCYCQIRRDKFEILYREITMIILQIIFIMLFYPPFLSINTVILNYIEPD